MVFGTAFGAMLLLVTLWCQDVWGWSALRTGLGVAPGPLLVPFWSIAAGPLARRIGPGPVAAAGCAIYAAGCVFWRLNLALTPDYAARMLPGHAADRHRRRPHPADPGQRGGLRGAAAPVRDRLRHRHHGQPGRHRPRRVAILVTVLGHPAGAGALPAFQRATVVLAATAFGAGLVDLLLIPARRRERDQQAAATRAVRRAAPG